MVVKKKKHSFRGKVKGDGERKASSGGGSNYLKLPQGLALYEPTPGKTEKIDIIPYIVEDEKHPDRHEESETAVVGEPWYKRPFKIHGNVGADNKRYICPTSIGLKCPICDYAKELSADGADWDEIKDFKPKDRVLYAVIPRGVKKVEEEIHLMDFSFHLFQKLLNQEVLENEKYEDFPSIEDGLTLKIRWEEKEFGKHKFADANRIDFDEREDEIDIDIMDDVPCLDDLLVILSYKELKEKFLESTPTETEEEDKDEDEAPKKTSKKNPFADKGKKAKKEVDEEEEKPVKKFKKAVEEVEEEETDFTWEEIKSLSESKLRKLCKDEDLETDPDDYDDDRLALQKAVAKEMGVKIPATKPAAKETKKKKRSEDDLEWEELAESNLAELIDIIEEFEIDVDPDDYEAADDLAKAIAEELDIEIPKKSKKK